MEKNTRAYNHFFVCEFFKEITTIVLTNRILFSQILQLLEHRRRWRIWQKSTFAFIWLQQNI